MTMTEIMKKTKMIESRNKRRAYLKPDPNPPSTGGVHTKVPEDGTQRLSSSLILLMRTIHYFQ